MAAVTVSVRVDETLHHEMSRHDEINWSAVLRKSIEQTITQLDHIDIARAKAATADMTRLRKRKAFAKGKTGTELVREWRDKRQ